MTLFASKLLMSGEESGGGVWTGYELRDLLKFHTESPGVPVSLYFSLFTVFRSERPFKEWGETDALGSSSSSASQRTVWWKNAQNIWTDP